LLGSPAHRAGRAGVVAMETLYFIVIDDTKQGPYVRDELIDAGMGSGTLVWYKGCIGWTRAENLPELAALLKEERKAQKRLRKERRRLKRLPEPGTLQWLCRLAMFLHVPAGALYVLGWISLLTAIVLTMIARRGALGTLFSITLLGGLTSLGVGLVVLLVEAAILAAFVWNCYRIVKVISPDEDREPNAFMEMLSGLSFDAPAPLMIIAFILFGVLVLFFLVTLLFILIVLAAFFLLVSYMHRLAQGLNRVIEEYNMDVPRAPVRLSFWTAMSSLLLVLGPFSLPLLILLPIWTFKMAAIAAEICERRREAVEGPPV
jgi:hypothetical protein